MEKTESIDSYESSHREAYIDREYSRSGGPEQNHNVNPNSRLWDQLPGKVQH